MVKESYKEYPERCFLCSASTYSFNSILWLCNLSASASNSWGVVFLITAVVFLSCSNTVDFFDLLEWSSKQNGSSPISAKRFWTTVNAAIFSATNRTFFPWYNAFAIIFVIVCDFPVPGGPCSIKLLSPVAALIASNWVESALIGNAISVGLYLLSKSISLEISKQSHSSFPEIRLLTILFSSSLAALLWMSFHIMNLLKENIPRNAWFSTSHLGCDIIPRRIMLNIFTTSTPLSSRGNSSKPLMVMPKSCLSISNRVMFINGSSSLLLMIYPICADFRTISTGNNSIGA